SSDVCSSDLVRPQRPRPLHLGPEPRVGPAVRPADRTHPARRGRRRPAGPGQRADLLGKAAGPLRPVRRELNAPPFPFCTQPRPRARRRPGLLGPGGCPVLCVLRKAGPFLLLEFALPTCGILCYNNTAAQVLCALSVPSQERATRRTLFLTSSPSGCPFEPSPCPALDRKNG